MKSPLHQFRPSRAVLTVVLLFGFAGSSTAFAADAAAPPAAKKSNKPDPLAQVADVAGLPRVLLIGDSVSLGYTLQVRKLLAGKANVHRPAVNCHSSRQVREELDSYLGDKPWDVIFINCGGHDLSYRQDGTGPYLPPPEGKIHVPLDEYQTNLHAIAHRLKQTKAKVIWGTITPMSDAYMAKGFRLERRDLKAYNAAAAKVMKEEQIPITDLYALTVADRDKLLRDGVHFKPQGYDVLAKIVSDAVLEQLPKSPK